MPFSKKNNKTFKQFNNISVGMNSKTTADIGISNKIQEQEFYEIEPGEVIDVILDDTHPDYFSPDDIGKAKVRLLYSETNKAYDDPKYLNWAKPADGNIRGYPLLHEIVLCEKYISGASGALIDKAGPETAPIVLYYSKKLNTNASVNHNALLDISLSNWFKVNSGQYEEPESLELGDTFKENTIIKPLKLIEGDISVEGRSGNSIRFGSEGGSGEFPILMIRNKQRSDTLEDDIYTEEDINLDGSSIWLTSNGVIPVDFPSTKFDSFTNLPILDGNQIFVNSDKIVQVAKEDSIILDANNSILSSANNEIGFNSKYFTVNSEYSFLGKYDNCQPMVLGNELLKILYEIVANIMLLTVANSAGTTSVPINANNFGKIIDKLENILSKGNFVS